MAARIEDDLMTAEFGGRVIDHGTTRTRRLMARARRWCLVSPAGCSAGTRRSRRWCSRSDSPRATATMIRSWMA